MTMWSPNKAQWDDDDDDFAYKTTMSADGEHKVEEVTIESKGYEILQDDTIKCADCGKKLIDIIKVKENEQLHKIISAHCPCGGESFLYVVTGETYMQASPGRTITDMPVEIKKDGTMHMTIKVI